MTASTDRDGDARERTAGEVREDLRHLRLDLLEREREHADRAASILEEIERTRDERRSGAILEEARRSAALAVDALRLGVVDTHRVGASVEEVARISGLSPEEIRAIVSVGGVDPSDGSA